MAAEFEFQAQCLYDQMDRVMKNNTHATSALDTRMAHYMHEYIRGNAECIRGNAECLAYMKEPAGCECEANPPCHTSDADCSNCFFNFMADMLKE